MNNSPSPTYIDSQNRYAVVRELGRGGMAIVYEVIDTHAASDTNRSSPQHVALKLAANDPAIRATSYERITQEFAIARALQGPRIVKVYDQGTATTGAPFFTMELLHGTPLSELIATRKVGTYFTVSEIVEILTQVAEALSTVHERGYVYADLKPANILVREVDGHYDIALLDFGITTKAVPFTPQLTLSTPSDTAALTGTSLYMSPEQVRGAPLTIRSDIYSFGILGFEVCTGEVPYQGEGLFMITASHLLAKIPSVREKNPEIPRGLERVIHSALEKLPGDRYGSISEVRATLNSVTKPKSFFSWLSSAVGNIFVR